MDNLLYFLLRKHEAMPEIHWLPLSIIIIFFGVTYKVIPKYVSRLTYYKQFSVVMCKYESQNV